MNVKKWEVAPLDKDRAAALSEECAIPFFLAMLLEARGVSTPEAASRLLGGGEELSDPFLMKDMDRAVERLQRAIDGFEKIAVYGDYDADGVTATAILFSYLEAVGADVLYYIPQREGEGYGMNKNAVETLHREGVNLIVTVDNGISSVEEAALAKSLGMDLVVTDHHRPQQSLPEAAAVVDAYREDDHSPFKDLSGAGVALKLLMALEGGDGGGVLSEYADLAALGTVGDVVPVVGENRLIVREGLRHMTRGDRPGVQALLTRCFNGRVLTAGNLAFTVIPRLNATGRMGAPDRAVQLLCCEDPEEAGTLADEICGDNEERRRVEAEIAREAVEKIENDPSLLYSRVIVVSGTGWHHGVIGIVASRIVERFGKPCFVVSEDGEGGSAKGSGRSVEGFSLFDAVCSCAPLLERFGGHPMAAGVTLKAENVEAFRKGLNDYAERVCREMPAPVLRIDCRLNPASLSPNLPRDLRLLEPFGSGNPAPLFGLYGMELREVLPVGGGGHLRLICSKRGVSLTCMRFGMTPEELPYRVGDKLDLAVTLDLREYRGEERLTVNVREMRPAGLDDQRDLHEFRLYERVRRGERLTRSESAGLTPSRDDLAVLYRRLCALRGGPFVLRAMGEELRGFGLGKLLLGLDVLEERGLLRCERSGETARAEIVRAQQKVDVYASPVFERLRTLTEGNL